MVAFASIACLSSNNGSPRTPKKQPTNDPLGILAFEAAKIVSRLISLYKSLSDSEISKLRKEIFKSKGVVYLNSDDEGHLLKLAYTEKMENLDKAAAAVARLARKCSDLMLSGFDTVYSDIKSGKMDLKKFDYGSGKTKKEIRMLKKFLSTTLYLYGSMKTFHGLEMSEKKLNFPVLLKYMNFPAIDLKITPPYRKQSRHVNNTNLWTQPFDKVVRLMSRVVCVIYARICVVFGPYVLDLPTGYSSGQRLVTDHIPSEYWILEPRNGNRSPRSRLIRSKSKVIKHFVRSNGRKILPAGGCKTNHLFLTAGPETVGGSRLQILYANLIMMAEESMKRRRAKDEMRDAMYKMLPDNLKAMVKMKIRKLKEDNNGGKEKMKEALHKIFVWLVPMAHNTLVWQRERRVDMTSLETKPPVLLLQTLHFSDKEKVEAAIAEVLAGLSLIYMPDNRREPAAA
ncbi:uncharacterized protein LOC112518319 [Cynara cardunculus var. scolymus]|uniref:Uncharacterized protein n=1 Tax=Cynara cardunculus var. scolymus TaxID=59895 RepID=A0A103XQM4_CYNCS|nr:uncharacterized protein LOC112518319 [Cynara cardunculus var. scolymus]KVH95009.1 Protein of unknown function DUF3475 [Cynara cardunculus var. scolymus]